MFWSYLNQIDYYDRLKEWIQEQYYCRKEISISVKENTLYDDLITQLFRSWKIDQSMVEEFSKKYKEKNTALNKLAMLGLFHSKDDICKKIQRLIITGKLHQFNL